MLKHFIQISHIYFFTRWFKNVYTSFKQSLLSCYACTPGIAAARPQVITLHMTCQMYQSECNWIYVMFSLYVESFPEQLETWTQAHKTQKCTTIQDSKEVRGEYVDWHEERCEGGISLGVTGQFRWKRNRKSLRWNTTIP